MQSSTVRIHPAAELFPMMSPEEHAGLVADIKENGVRTVLQFLGESWDDSQLIDGRNRLKAIEELGLRYRDHATLISPDDMPDPIKHVLSLNLHRRHLDESQRGLIAGEIAKLRQGGDRDGSKLQICNFENGSTTLDNAAKALNVSKRTASSGRKVATKGTDELRKEVADGKISVSKAAKIASKPKEQQAAAIAEEKKPKPKRKSKPKAKVAAPTPPDEPTPICEPLKALREIHQTTNTQEDQAVKRFAEWVLSQDDIKTIHTGCSLWSEWK